MSLRVDRVQLDIIINNDQARKQMRLLDEELKQAQKDLKKLPEQSEEWVQKSKRIDSIRVQMENIKRQIGITGMTMKELTAHQKELNMVLANMRPNIPQYKVLQKELSDTNARIKELRAGAQQTQFSLGKVADGFNKYFNVGIAAFAAVAGVTYTIKEFITGTSQLEDSFADIRKTTGMTIEEVKQLNSQFGKIDTRTSRQELREMAIVAGQLGIAKNDVLAFVESVDKLNVALGDEIKGGAEEVSRTMGTLRNVLTDMKTARVDDDMLRIGNALNVLGAAGFATSPVMADFSNRIGGIGITLGMTSDEVLGLSATLQELNVSTERGGTAIGRILQKMTNNTAEFSKVAGMNVDDFTKLVNEDLFSAFLKVVEGSRRGGESATVLAGIIKDLEIQGAGASEVFAKLSGNTDMLREKVDLAGQSLQNTDSITAEFNIKNATLGATVDKLRKDLYGLVTMSSVVEFFKNITYQLTNLVHWFKELPQTVEKYKVSLTVLMGVMLTWTAVKLKSVAASVLNNIALKEGIGLKIKDAVVLRALVIQEELRAAMIGKTTIAQKAAAVGSVALGNALKLLMGPIGWVGLAITGLVAGIKAYDKYNSESIRLDKEKNLAISQTGILSRALEQTYNALADQQRNFSRLSIQEKKDLADKIDLTIKQAEAELILLQAKQKQIRDDNSKPTYWQGLMNTFKSFGAISGMVSRNLEDAVNNGKEAASGMSEGINNIRQSLDNLKKQKVDIGDILQAENIGDAIGTATIEELDEKMSKYNVALRNAVKGSEDYIRIQQKIKEVNKLQGALSIAPDDDDKTLKNKTENAKKEAEKYVNILQDVKNFEAQQLEDRMNGFLKEVSAVERKYDAEIAKAKEFLRESKNLNPEKAEKVKTEISTLEADKDKAVKALMLSQEEKFTDDVIKLRNKLVLAQYSGYEQELQEINQTYNAKIDAVTEQMAALEVYYAREVFLAGSNYVKVSLIETEKATMLNGLWATVAVFQILKSQEVSNARKKQDDELKAMMKEASAELASKGLSEKERELKAIDDKYAKMLILAKGNAEQTADIEKMHADETNEYLKQQKKEVYKELVRFGIEQAQLLSDTVFTISSNNRSSELDSELSKLNKQKEKELSNKNLTESQKAKINEKYDKKEADLKLKNWKANQDAAVTQAAINGALAITNILATMNWADFGVMHAIAIAAATASTLAQIAVIKSEKPPEFYSGGYTGDGNKLEPAGIVHKREYVIPEEVMNDPSIQKVIQYYIEPKRKGQTVTGVPGFQQVSVPQMKIPSFDIAQIEKSIRFAPLSMQYELTHRYDQTGSSRTDSLNTDQLRIFEELNKTLSEGIRAKMVYSEWQETKDKVDNMISDTSI